MLKPAGVRDSSYVYTFELHIHVCVYKHVWAHVCVCVCVRARARACVRYYNVTTYTQAMRNNTNII